MKWYLTVLKKYVVFSGRATRSEYWYFTLFDVIISFILIFVDAVMENELLYNFYHMAVLIPTIAVSVRRMHDVDKSGWYCLIPIYNLILACTEGTTGINKFGADPKRSELLDDIELIGTNTQ